MADAFLADRISRPDFYIAAMGRSGSTALCNWLTRPPDQLVFVEPFFLRPTNPRLLRIQLANFGLAICEDDWRREDLGALERFRRIMWPRLRGRRWAFKEVLCEEHLRVLDAFAPPRILITVRDVADVALSFFEKHRLQGNLKRFDDEWVIDYCLRESAGLVEFRHLLENRGIPFRVIRYEEFTRSQAARDNAADFVSWEPGGALDSHLEQFDRRFEVERHGREFSDSLRGRSERLLDRAHLEAADQIASRCAAYQSAFGYA